MSDIEARRIERDETRKNLAITIMNSKDWKSFKRYGELMIAECASRKEGEEAGKILKSFFTSIGHRAESPLGPENYDFKFGD